MCQLNTSGNLLLMSIVAIILKLIISLRLSEDCGIIPQTIL